MADAVVTSRIILEGENRTGKAIKEAEQQAGKLGESLKGAADKSGDLERGVLGIRDIVGSVGGPLGEVADRFGGIEGVLKGLPGLLGPIALAAAAVAAGVGYYYQQAEENRKKALQAQQAELELIGQSTSELAKRAGLETSLVLAAEQRLTVEQAQAKVAQELAAANSAQIALLKAMEGQDQIAISNARTLLGLKQQQVQTAGYLVEEATRSQIVATQTKDLQLDAILVARREELEISRIADTRQRTDEQAIRLRKQLLDTEHELNKAAADRLRLQAEISVMRSRGDMAGAAKASKELEDAVNRQNAAASRQIEQEDKLYAIKRELDTYEANQDTKRMQRIAKAAAMRQKAEQERQRQMQESDRVSKEFADRAVARLNAYGREVAMQIRWEREAAASLAESYTLLEDARIDAASPAEREQLEYLRERKRLTQELVAVQLDLTRGAADAANRQTALLIRLDSLDKRKNTEQQARAQKQADERINLGFQVADAAVGALAMVEGAELAAAGVKATLAVAEGLYAVAKSGPAGVPQLLAGIAAAAQFALAAGSSPPSTPSLGGGGGGQSMAPAGVPDNRPITINVQGAIIGTPQQVGQSITKAVKSLKGTGYTAKAGA